MHTSLSVKLAKHLKLVGIIGLLLCSAARADMRSDWNLPQKPFLIYGNTYYVGTHGLSSILITSKGGHILLDGALPESVPLIAANIRSLGFRLEDVKLILNSHVHFDHAGGIAELQKLTGAKAAASPSSAKALMSGAVDRDDPQFALLPPIARVTNVQVFKNRETLTVGSLAVTAHLTPGHTPGGTSWTWNACEKQQCVNVVYADSLNPISDKEYRYADNTRKPNGVQQLESSFTALSTLPCDILLVPHPDVADLFGKLARRETAVTNPFVDPKACVRYVQMSREKLAKRLAEEALSK